MLFGDSLITTTKHQVSCELSGEAVILNLQSGVYYGLNRVGARIWNLLQKPITLDGLQTVVLKEFDVDTARCVDDLNVLVQELLRHGLIEIRASAENCK
jgi:hypothetical protein